MPRTSSLSTRLWPLALSLGISMLLHGAVVEVWSAWQSGEGSAVVLPSGVSVRIAQESSGLPEPVAALARPEPTRLAESVARTAPVSDNRKSPSARPVVVSQATQPNLDTPAPRPEPAVPVQPAIAAAATTIMKTETPPPAPVLLEPTYVMGSPQNPEPAYPFVARKFGWEGLVRITVDVTASGQPQQVDVLASSGHTVLDQAALTTIRDQWQFQPALQNGIAVPGKVTVPVQFVLQE